MQDETAINDLMVRVQRVEDELAIRQLILSYGPAADAGLTSFAAGVWFDDGVYDWDTNADPYLSSAAVDAMLQGDGHQGFIANGAAHFTGPPLRQDDKFDVWRVSAVRWDVERSGTSWRARRRTNRLLDSAGEGRKLFGTTLRELLGAGPPHRER